MNINEAARQSGVSAATIRYYEERGLVGPVPRTGAGYRIFSGRDVRMLDFLRRARELGFSLDECGELARLIAAPDRLSEASIRRTRKLAEHRLDEIRTQIEALERRRDLIQLHVDSLDVLAEECPITRDL